MEKIGQINITILRLLEKEGVRKWKRKIDRSIEIETPSVLEYPQNLKEEAN